MDLKGPSLEQMTRRAEDAARHMRYSIKLVLIALAGDIDAKTPSADDLVRAQAYWEHQVEKIIQPDIRAGLHFGADLIHKLLKDNTVPRVTNDYAELYLLTTKNRISGIGGQVWETARFELLDGMARGEDIDSLRTRIKKSLKISSPRAETIARTEVNGAMNAGSLIQMQSIGLPFTKTWLATGGSRTRPSHAKADGQTVKGTKKFTVGGWPMDRPHDPAAPPEETENCRCTMTFEIPEQKRTEKQQEKKDKELLDALFASVGLHNAPGDHPMGGGGQYISRDGPPSGLDWGSLSAQIDSDRTQSVLGAVEDHTFESLVGAQGFDGKPRTLDAAGMESAPGHGWIRTYRGLHADDQSTVDGYAHDWSHGRFFPGTGAEGSGAYTTSSRDYASEYAGHGSNGRVLNVAIHPSAKIISSRDLSSEMFDTAGSMTGDQRKVLSDPGRFAAWRGYDVIHRQRPGSGADFYVVINRTATAVEVP